MNRDRADRRRKKIASTKPETQQKIINQHKFINNKLLVNGLKSTKISGLPTVAEKKASGRFGIVDDEGKPLYIFYPYAEQDSGEKRDDDIGFILWDVAGNKSSDIEGRLGDSEYAQDPNFISFENAVSAVPHYVK